jgi:hypothetical protein
MATNRRGKTVVVRLSVPDEEAQEAALKLLLEQTQPGRASVDGSEASGTDERRPTNGGEDV